MNGYVEMRGMKYMIIKVNQYGKIETTEKAHEFAPVRTNNMSEVEYELLTD